MEWEVLINSTSNEEIFSEEVDSGKISKEGSVDSKTMEASTEITTEDADSKEVDSEEDLWVRLSVVNIITIRDVKVNREDLEGGVADN